MLSLKIPLSLALVGTQPGFIESNYRRRATWMGGNGPTWPVASINPLQGCAGITTSGDYPGGIRGIASRQQVPTIHAMPAGLSLHAAANLPRGHAELLLAQRDSALPRGPPMLRWLWAAGKFLPELPAASTKPSWWSLLERHSDFSDQWRNLVLNEKPEILYDSTE